MVRISHLGRSNFDGNDSEQTEFSGIVPFIELGGSHVTYAPGFQIFLGFNWGLAWIPRTDIDREPVGTSTSGGAGTVLDRQNRFSYQSSNEVLASVGS